VQRVAPHDHRVLAVVRVVAAAAADGAETEALVQADGVGVAGAHLQGDPARPQLVAALDERREEGGAVSLVLALGAHADGGDVRLVDDLPEPAVADDLGAVAEHDVVGLAVLRQLGRVGVPRPGREEDLPLDRLDRRNVGGTHLVDDQVRGDLHHSDDTRGLPPGRSPSSR